MADWLIVVTCPRCGADLDPVAQGAPHRARTAAIGRCSECARGWVIHVQLLAVDVADRSDTGSLVTTAPQVSRPQVMTTCKVCGEPMPKYRRETSHNARTVCGPECAAEGRRRARQQKVSV